MTGLLLGLYLVFHVVTSPFLDVERKKQQFVSNTGAPVLSPEFRAEAAKWFPQDAWVEKSGKHFRDSGRYVYFEDFDLAEEGRSVIFKPIAMLWRTERDETPVTIVAESAQLYSSRPFSLQDPQLGRITGGLISGNVRIRGPDGLNISGRTFNLSEDSMMLWSSEPVQFAWQGHSGTAASGVEIHFNGDPAEGLLKVTDVRSVNLLGRVACNFLLPGRRNGDEDLRMKINAAQGFSFDVLTTTATFQGASARPGRRSSPNRPTASSEEVWVQRKNSDGSLDQLVCPELKLQFRRRISPETGEAEGRSLQLEHITAWGARVVFHSQQQDIWLIGNDLQYNMDAGRFDVWHTKRGADGQPSYVEVRQGKSRLFVPHIRAFHDRGGAIQRVECNGPGTISGTTPERNKNDADTESATVEANEPVFGAAWQQALTMQLAADQLSRIVSLRGAASVSQIDRGFKLEGQTITMKLASTATAPKPRNRLLQVSSTGTVADENNADERVASDPSPQTEKQDKLLPTDIEQLKPELLTATGNVMLTSPEGTGRLRDRLTVRFEDMVPTIRTSSDTRGGIFQTIGQSSNAAETGRESLGGNENEEAVAESTVSFISDTLEAIVRISSDPENRQVQFHNVWLNGNVEVVRESDDPDDAFSAKGNQLYAATGLKNDRDIQLFGDPAKLTRATGTLEGPRIDVKELAGRAEVVGSGKIRFLTDKGFDGKVLAEPMPLDIFWTDHMHVESRSAHFVGNIRVVMTDDLTQQIEVRCSGLTVHFDRDITMRPGAIEGQFEASPTDASGAEAVAGPVERIEFHNRVVVSIKQMVDNTVNGRHNAEFADLEVNLKTGDFHAVGPGFLKSVTPDKKGQLQGSIPPAARANAPAQTRDAAFVSMNVAFIGELIGNLHRQDATLSHHVQAVVVPVRRVDETINLDDVSTMQLPERAGILSAEQLTVTAIPGHDGQPTSFAIVARTNARLESQTISGNADVITYDQSKEQFILRAEGEGFVTVNHRASSDGRFNRTVGKRFEYYRSTNQLSADQIRSLDVSQ